MAAPVITPTRRTFSLQPGLEKTFRFLLNTRIGVCDRPLRVLDSVLQIPMFCRKVILLANVDQLDHGFAFARYSKTNCIPRALHRKTRTGRGVSETAFILQLVCVGNHAVVARRSTVTMPAPSQGQARWMEPDSILSFVGRHEKRTSQVRLLANFAAWLGMSSHCTQRAVASPAQVGVRTAARRTRLCSNLIRKRRGPRTWIALRC